MGRVEEEREVSPPPRGQEGGGLQREAVGRVSAAPVVIELEEDAVAEALVGIVVDGGEPVGLPPGGWARTTAPGRTSRTASRRVANPRADARIDLMSPPLMTTFEESIPPGGILSNGHRLRLDSMISSVVLVAIRVSWQFGVAVSPTTAAPSVKRCRAR